MKSNPSNTHIRQEYRQVSNLVQRYDTKEKAASISKLQSSDSKQFWWWANSVKRHRDVLPPLQSASGDVTDDTVKAGIFNNYFKSVFTVENLAGLDDLKSSITYLSPILDSITFTPEDVYQELIKLDPSKACCPDGNYDV